MKSLQAFLALFALSARGMNTPLLLIASLLSIGLLGACVTSGSYEEELGHLTADQQFAKVKSLSVIGTGRMERPPTGLTRLTGWRRRTPLLKNAFFRERKWRW